MVAPTPVTRQQVVDEARTWIGTAHRHQGRLKGIGVDCVGLIIGVAHALNLSDYDITGYSLRPEKEMAKYAKEQMTPIAVGNAKAGDVLLMTWNRAQIHLGFLTDTGSIIHSTAIVGKVVEHSISDSWRAAISGAFRLPGIE